MGRIVQYMSYTFSDLQFFASCLVQAMLGAISCNFRFVSVAIDGHKVLVRIVLEQEVSEDLDEIDDLKTEFEALMPGPIDYEFAVEITSESIPWPDRSSSIVVFKRRE